MVKLRRFLTLALGLLAPATALGQAVHLCLGAYLAPVEAEVASSAVERERGFRGRAAPAPGSGMLFVYSIEQPVSQGFWMYQISFPLDIAFISAEGRIVSIATMEPCLSADPKACPAYYSEKPFKSALEVNAGFFAAAGTGVGEKVWEATNETCMPE